MPTISELLNVGQEHHRSGNLRAAEEIYRQVLQAAPDTAEAWNLMGVLAHQVGRPETALECVRYALQLDPSHAQARQNLAALDNQRRAGQIEPGGATTSGDVELELWIGQAYRIGMLQIKEEILPLCSFLRQRNLNHVMEIGSCQGGTFYLWTRLARGKKISLERKRRPVQRQSTERRATRWVSSQEPFSWPPCPCP